MAIPILKSYSPALSLFFLLLFHLLFHSSFPSYLLHPFSARVYVSCYVVALFRRVSRYLWRYENMSELRTRACFIESLFPPSSGYQFVLFSLFILKGLILFHFTSFFTP